MILKSFILGNLVSFSMKLINSVVVVGLYYGFLTTFSIGPSYLFLLRARVMEEGTEKKVSATTGFITGQLMMFISIYYAPLHLALGRPHTITVLALPYLLFHFFWNNHKHFFDYGSTTRNSMRNLSIQCVFLNNLIFQLFNHFILPSSMLVRLVNIYMFRCNNKMLFVTSSFVGWLIGHILFMKWLGLVLVWIQQKNSIRSNVLIRSNKYLVSELRNSMARIFSILLFITCVYYLGRMPSPIFTKKLKEMEERGESEEETDVEIETTSETKGTKWEQEESTEEDPSPSLFSEEKEDPDKIDETEKIRMNGKEKTKDKFHFHFKETCYKNRPDEKFYLNGNKENSKLEKLKDKKKFFSFRVVTFFFNFNRWNRPFRYIKTDRFETPVRTEMSQYFFYTCQSDGKETIFFMYPPSLSTFFEMIQKRMFLFTNEQISTVELHNHWSYRNKQKWNKLNKELINRIKSLNKKIFTLNGFKKRVRLCNDDTQKEYLHIIYDPLGSGPRRKKKKFLRQIPNKTSIKNYMKFWINKIHSIFIITNYRYCEKKLDAFDRKFFSREIYSFLTLINQFAETSNLKLSSFPEYEKKKFDSEDLLKFLKFLFDTVIVNDTKLRKRSIQIKEIDKKIPRWSHKLINDLELQERQTEESVAEENGIRSRKAKRVIIFTANQQNVDNSNKDSINPDQTKEVALIRYSQQSDFRRDLIKGSMRTQRRKTVTWEFLQANVHSPAFLDRIDKPLFFSFDIYELMKIMFISWIQKNSKITISNYTEKKKKEGEKKEEDKREEDKREEDKRKEKARIEIAETWDSLIFAQIIRGLVLITQSTLRKYILIPLLIIAKNLVRILLFQFPEWSEDFKDWTREIHVKCTYNGVQLSEREFPKNWLTDGIQIKILFPFRLKPWHKYKLQFPHKEKKKKKEQKNDFCFLTVWGMKTELPFGSPKKQLSLFEPIKKKIKKKILKLKKRCFIIIKLLKERTAFFLNINILKELTKKVIKNILFLKELLKEISKRKRIPFFGFRKIYELNEIQKDSTINKRLIQESSIQIKSISWYSLTKKKMKDLTDRTSEIRKKIEKITKDKKKKYIFLTLEKNTRLKKKNSDDKSLGSPPKKLQILKIRHASLIHKSHYLIILFFEKIYINILLCIINITKISTQVFRDSKIKIFDKSIYYNKNKENKKRIHTTNRNTIHFISTTRKLLSNKNIFNTKSKTFSNLSLVSQAYVFYKLSQTQVINFYKLRSALQYHGTSLFLKNEIKDYFGTQGIFHSELRNTQLRNSIMNPWKIWLKAHYQYDFPHIRWSRLISKKLRNKLNHHDMAYNKNLIKDNSYEKDRLIHDKKQKNFEADSLLNKNKIFKKTYKYDLLAYKSINYEDKTNSYIYGSTSQVINKKDYFFNYNARKRKFFDTLEGIPRNNYLGEDDIMDMDKNPDKKYFGWRILNFCLRKRVDIESWIDTGTKNNKNIKIGTHNYQTNNYQIIDKIDTKNLFYLTIHQDQEMNPSKNINIFFDWMGMNEKVLSHSISNLELLFLPKFVILNDIYKMKPWIIPIKLLLLSFNKKSINKNIKKKGDLFISSKKKINIKLENRNQEEKELEDQAILGPIFSKHEEKDVKKDYVGSDSDMKKRKKKQYKNNTKVDLFFFLKRYLRFQLRWDNSLSLNQRIINNIKIYCLLLRLKTPKEIVISSIQREEMSLDILIIQKDLTFTELMKKAILIIEPIRLSVKNDEKFIMYQTISISLIHKSKHQINQSYREESYVDKKNFVEYISKHQKMARKRNKNFYDLLIPENILSPKHRKELRIVISFNSKKKRGIHINTEFCTETQTKNYNHILDDKSKRDKNKLIKLKFFLWPNYRLEDLACMNRYWFDTNNSSRFSMVRMHMYTRLKIS
uniref:Protein TIC 214 n=2 Tax=Mesangiospermae TaxID=1437183 RepID=D3WEV7_9ROSI|nr:putative RF1 protein [Oxalis latifolia]